MSRDQVSTSERALSALATIDATEREEFEMWLSTLVQVPGTDYLYNDCHNNMIRFDGGLLAFIDEVCADEHETE